MPDLTPDDPFANLPDADPAAGGQPEPAPDAGLADLRQNLAHDPEPAPARPAAQPGKGRTGGLFHRLTGALNRKTGTLPEQEITADFVTGRLQGAPGPTEPVQPFLSDPENELPPNWGESWLTIGQPPEPGAFTLDDDRTADRAARSELASLESLAADETQTEAWLLRSELLAGGPVEPAPPPEPTSTEPLAPKDLAAYWGSTGQLPPLPAPTSEPTIPDWLNVDELPSAAPAIPPLVEADDETLPEWLQPGGQGPDYSAQAAPSAGQPEDEPDWLIEMRRNSPWGGAESSPAESPAHHGSGSLRSLFTGILGGRAQTPAEPELTDDLLTGRLERSLAGSTRPLSAAPGQRSTGTLPPSAPPAQPGAPEGGLTTAPLDLATLGPAVLPRAESAPAAPAATDAPAATSVLATADAPAAVDVPAAPALSQPDQAASLPAASMPAASKPAARMPGENVSAADQPPAADLFAAGAAIAALANAEPDAAPPAPAADDDPLGDRLLGLDPASITQPVRTSGRLGAARPAPAPEPSAPEPPEITAAGPDLPIPAFDFDAEPELPPLDLARLVWDSAGDDPDALPEPAPGFQRALDHTPADLPAISVVNLRAIAMDDYPAEDALEPAYQSPFSSEDVELAGPTALPPTGWKARLAAGRAWFAARAPLEKVLLVEAVIVALVVLIAIPVFIILAARGSANRVVVYPTARPLPANLPYPVGVTLPGGWYFGLAKSTFTAGQWRPAASEWLEGTEVRRVVALPWNRQTDAVVRSFEPGDPIQVLLSNQETLTYTVETVQRVPAADNSVLTGQTPALAIILYGEKTPDRWVILAKP